MTDLANLAPWVVVLIVFVGMLALCWRMAGSLHELAKLLAQILAGQPKPATVPSVPVPPKVPAPIPTPTPAGPFADAPKWFQGALHEIASPLAFASYYRRKACRLH